jgi:protein-disulfide isomerase
MHLNARMLANAALCADRQNKYWAMHDTLVQRKPATHSEVLDIATSLGLNNLEFHGCLIGNEFNSRIESSIQKAKSLNIRTTPSFAVGTINPDGQVMVQKIINGAQPLKVFEQVIGDIRRP